MDIVCPHCGKEFDFEENLKNSANDRILKIYCAFGENIRLSAAYMRCFRNHEHVPLRESRHLRLLEEVFEISRTGVFHSGGKKYVVHGKRVLEAMKIICEKNLSGLKNHNYLKAILKESRG